MGQKQKTEKKKEEEERLNDGDNNGQATHGARKHAWRTQAAWAKIQNLCVWSHQITSSNANLKDVRMGADD